MICQRLTIRNWDSCHEISSHELVSPSLFQQTIVDWTLDNVGADRRETTRAGTQ